MQSQRTASSRAKRSTLEPIGGRLRHQIRSGRSLVSFLYSKYAKGPVRPSEPAFDEDGLKLFASTIAKTSVYLEYGSGGSTILASKCVRFLVSVDSDQSYLAAVAAAIGVCAGQENQKLVYVNIGVVREWGYPIFVRPTKARRERWKNYPRAPWGVLKSHGLQPDTILIDGRFRVACALQSFLNIENAAPCRILVDDYVDRLEYRTIEEFGDLVEMSGRMALFQRKSNFDAEKCRAALELSTSIPD